MCLGEKDRNGPRRCSGHARAGYQGALADQQAAAATASEARAKAASLEVAVGQAEEARILARRRLDSAVGTGDISDLEQAYDAEVAVESDLKAQWRQAGTERDDALGKASYASAVLQNRRAAYESTPEGLAMLESEINDNQQTLRDMAARGEAQGEESTRLSERVHDQLRRRSEAEARMEDEAEARRRNKDYTPFDSELEQRRIDELQERAAESDDDDDATKAEKQGLRQQITKRQGILNAHRREDAVLGGYKAAVAGHAQQTPAEREAFRGISSIHRPMHALKGGETIEVRLYRTEGDQRFSTKVELNRSDFAAEDPLTTTPASAGRTPSTTDVMRHLIKQREEGSKAHHLSEHLKNGGTREGWHAAVKAARALDALSGKRAETAAA